MARARSCMDGLNLGVGERGAERELLPQREEENEGAGGAGGCGSASSAAAVANARPEASSAHQCTVRRKKMPTSGVHLSVREGES